MEPVKELRVHLGAHKTATTHLQDTLLAHQNNIALHGIDYIPRERFGPLQRRFSDPSRWRKNLWSWPVERLFKRQFQKLREGGDVVLLSDEDLLGYAYDLFTSPIYPDLRGLHTIRSLAKDTKLKLFLGVRSFDRLLPSAFAQTIKTIAPEPDWLDEVLTNMSRTPPSWVDLVDRLMAMFPDASLMLWRYEDYSAHSQEILTSFVGQDVGQFPELPPPVRTTSPSHDAILKAEKIDRHLAVEERRAQVRRIYYEELPIGDGRTAFKPLDQADAARLVDRYEQDLHDLEQRYPRMIFKPSATS
ncbi:hypothetical protein [Pseudohalocynthiibacter sp. F2068]|jgi:hypothetical protein|uniref:hypothetical protein n=1 Tax=Pseudohalocynthiibacter sp. F2068 TaxID=2926418 RepID=UPI001FF4AED6|nr:hypothetical protein [Pseudohalocynthiibacter sp. F2068]MCK0103902.1 hypothetical protein [Pseudohalocynthiibacter sp. F2068]